MIQSHSLYVRVEANLISSCTIGDELTFVASLILKKGC